MTEQRESDLGAIGLLDEPVRRRLYDWVVAQGRAVGRVEAAKALKITRALATFHLDRLTEAGLLDGGYQRLSGKVGPGAGRPARVYRRADREIAISLPERRYEQAAQLFAAALEEVAAGEPPVALQAAARELGAKLGTASRRGRPAHRLERALQAGGYEPETDETGTIRLRNCPFHALAQAHRPLVCGTNLQLATGIAEGAGVTDLHPILDPRPGHCCVAFETTESPRPAEPRPTRTVARVAQPARSRTS